MFFDFFLQFTVFSPVTQICFVYNFCLLTLSLVFMHASLSMEIPLIEVHYKYLVKIKLEFRTIYNILLKLFMCHQNDIVKVNKSILLLFYLVYLFAPEIFKCLYFYALN